MTAVKTFKHNYGFYLCRPQQTSAGSGNAENFGKPPRDTTNQSYVGESSNNIEVGKPGLMNIGGVENTTATF